MRYLKAALIVALGVPAAVFLLVWLTEIGGTPARVAIAVLIVLYCARVGYRRKLPLTRRRSFFDRIGL
jgi:Flp pilus assembly protein TadB